MGCSCGKSKGTAAWFYVDENGAATKYPNRLQAEAAKIRNGNQGRIENKID